MGVLIRLLFLAALVWLVVSLVRRALSPPRDKPSPAVASPMRACAHCGLHVPESECVRAEGRYFCCQPHRDAWLRNPT